MNRWLNSAERINLSYWVVLLFLVFIFFGCNKGLNPVSSAKENEGHQPIASVARNNRYITIDTVLQSIGMHVAALPIADANFAAKVRKETTRFYAANHNQTKWLGNIAATNLFYAFTNNVRSAENYGLRPADYGITQLEEEIKEVYSDPKADSSIIIKLDIHITQMFFLFSSHLTEGRIQKTGRGPNIWIRESPRQIDLVNVLLRIEKPEQLREEIKRLQPANDQYAKLQSALDQYRYLDQLNPDVLGSISISGKIQPGDNHAAIPLIRERLSFTDLKMDSTRKDSLRYDETLVSAVKGFQQRHGLEPDGIIGSVTLKFLNQSFKEKAEIIELNLERMRWAPETYGDNYILVNIPEYSLHLYEDNKPALSMKVIVGSAETPTPVFADTLRYIVFSPTWSVPTSIIKNEIIPRLQKDSSYYSLKNYMFYKSGIQIDPAAESWKGQTINPYSLNVVQQSGPDNSLGEVKFVMPNNMNIYLHDTPGQHLFRRYYRALSHGCVRLDEPAELAEFLLKDQRGWDAEAVNKAMKSGQAVTLFLKKPYRVQLEYYTAWVDDNGMVNFREDIYGHDRYQLSQLKLKKEVKKSEVLFAEVSGLGN
jgi:murein L,D-transpeptidase YcbB/YkuD